MGWLSRIVARITSTFRREQLAADVRDELECHLSLLTEQNIKDGISVAQARGNALRMLGNPDTVRDEYLRAAGIPVLDRVLADAKQALLEWRRDRALSTTVVLLLTIGIAVAALIFALAPQLRKLSSCGSHARGIFAIVHYSAHGLGDWNHVEIPIWDSPAEYDLWKSKTTSFDELTEAEPLSVILDVNGRSARLRARRVADNFFHFLHARAAMGEPSADYKSWNDEQGVVIGYKLWKTMFAADPRVVGRKIHIDGNEFHVSGVMPPELAYVGQLWLALHSSKDSAWVGAHHVNVLARLKPGVSQSSAEAELRKLVPVRSDPNAQLPEDATTEVIPLQRFVDDINDQSITALLWMAAGILVAAWVNAATLLLQRTIRRAREFSVRGALGAPRERLAGEITLQVLFLSLLACIVAIAAVAGADWFLLSSFSPQFLQLSWISVFRIECNYIALLAGISTLLCAIPSVIWAGRCRPIPVSGFQKQASQAAGPYRDSWRSALVGCQIALALVALIGAGEMFRTFSWQWMKFRFRQAPKNVLAMELGIKQPET
ncbi:MAG TPA: ABC transporter permease, partial [Terriglobales bacterium]|nr:ABC transporter permease [Terriglobales bacterium]